MNAHVNASKRQWGKRMPEPVLTENINLLSAIESRRKAANGKLEKDTKAALGQYMTPSSVASFMASLFPAPASRHIKLLDPGAGVGSLTSAFVDHFCKTYSNVCIDLTAYEIDSVMQDYLRENLTLCGKSARREKKHFTWELINKDFVIETSRMIASTDSLWKEDFKTFSHCIMNPPYKKILSSSRHRSALRTAGIETVNLYSAFVALSVLLLEKKGYLVAIIPRSFCNGPYYRPFRELLLKNTAIKRIHLFNSRNTAFKEDKVLQENIIIALEKNGEQGDVSISTSTDETFADIAISNYPFRNIVKKSDRELFIHIPTSPDDVLDLSENFSHPLSDIRVNISTGPVVDFRMKKHLRQMPGKGTVPLLYPCHFKKNTLVWPIENGKKPNAMIANSDTKKWLYPNGFYTVVRRFSSKEETRRIVAGIVHPDLLDHAENIGLENHLNVFHINKKPLTEDLARGLAVYLNSTIVDEYFRRFSGHTQVNATDLKLMTYPSRRILSMLGKWASSYSELTQEMIDKKIESISK